MSELTGNPHRRVRVGYLVTGLVFIGLAGSWGLRVSGAVGDITVGWLVPATLVVAGVIGLVAMLAGGVRRGRPTPDAGTEPEAANHGPSHGRSRGDDQTNDTTDLDASNPEAETTPEEER